MNAMQLEFNLKDESDVDVKLNIMSSHIASIDESMGKVRRKLFSQVCELNKLYLELKNENELLKQAIRELKNERTDWTFGQKGTLFDVPEFKEAAD